MRTYQSHEDTSSWSPLIAWLEGAQTFHEPTADEFEPVPQLVGESR